MRYGVLADVHGNLHALHAVLDALDVDGYLCAGDLVGYGPLPNECVAAIAALGATCVAGNHDLIAVGRLSTEGCTPFARASLEWTSRQLDPSARRYLEGLPLSAVEGGVVLAHGSLGDPSEYVREHAQRIEQLRRLEREHPSARVLVLGHTHLRAASSARRGPLDGASIPLAAGDRFVVNPGSVGQSRERSARARFAVLDDERVTFQAVRYDVAACRRALERRGLPPRSHHVRPHGRLRRAAARLGLRA